MLIFEKQTHISYFT